MNETIPTSTPPAADPTAARPTQVRRPLRLPMVLLWLGIVALLAMLGWGLMNTTAARPEVGQTAPDFDVAFFDGFGWNGRTTASLQDMRGQVVVLNFWASWCVECRDETPMLESAWQKYGDQGVVVLGVAYADVEPNSLAYMEDFGVSFPHAPDLGTDISQTYEITGVPETFIIDKEGVIRHVQIGAVNEAMLDQIIPELLAQ